jgi:predicted nuclease of restriction endonuclease-like (RecB) superfamily
MNKLPAKLPRDYASLLSQVKDRIRQAQTRAVLSANAEMIWLYWDVGQMLLRRQAQKGWGAGVLDRLARDIHNDLAEIKGFSRRNLFLMTQFCREYPNLSEIVQPAIAQLASGRTLSASPPTAPKLPEEHDIVKVQQLVAQLPWAHNVLLIQKIKELSTRLWYMQQTLQNGWSRNVLLLMIKSEAHGRRAKAITNFPERLPPTQSDLAVQALKDPYIFDFLTLEQPFHERELETELLKHLEKFLVELGQGFAFVGRQFHVAIGEDDFYIDLLFYHLTLRCFVVIDLKAGRFKAEHAGKMNFYLNVVDDKLRHATDQPSIGLILCQHRNRVVAEYALHGIKKPIGISQYEITRALPKELRSSLPSIEEIEAELTPSAKQSRKQSLASKRHSKQ